jgi:hypothetical protein
MNSIDAFHAIEAFYRPKAKSRPMCAFVMNSETHEILILDSHLSQFEDLEFLVELTRGNDFIMRGRYLQQSDDVELEMVYSPKTDN